MDLSRASTSTPVRYYMDPSRASTLTPVLSNVDPSRAPTSTPGNEPPITYQLTPLIAHPTESTGSPRTRSSATFTLSYGINIKAEIPTSRRGRSQIPGSDEMTQAVQTEFLVSGCVFPTTAEDVWNRVRGSRAGRRNFAQAFQASLRNGLDTRTGSTRDFIFDQITWKEPQIVESGSRPGGKSTSTEFESEVWAQHPVEASTKRFSDCIVG